MTSAGNSTSNDDRTSGPPLLFQLWQLLLAEPWKVAIVVGIPCIVVILIALAAACCMTIRSKRRSWSAPSKETADDDDADSKGLPSVANGALEMVTIDPSDTLTSDTAGEEAAHQAVGETATSPPSPPADAGVYLGERDESSVGSLPTESPTERSLFPTPRSFKQRRTSSTSNEQRTLAYVEVELNPVTEENKAVIISKEKPTQYAEIAGVYKPFCPK